MLSRKTLLFAGAILAAVLFLARVHAQDGQAIPASAGDTAWLLTAAALVMMMTVPGLALFYGGLVSQRNVLSVLMQSFFLLCLISVQWVLWGYSISFAPDKGGLLGGLQFVGLGGVGQDPAAGST